MSNSRSLNTKNYHMIATYEFKVLNKVTFSEIWPVRLEDKTLSFEETDGIVTAIKISIKADAKSYLPKITPNPSKGVSALIEYKDSILFADALDTLLSWQASVVPFAPISIDFDTPKISFDLEPGEEKPDNTAFGLSFSYNNEVVTCDYENVAKAFLIGAKSEVDTQALAFFREGRLSFLAGRFIDAYLNYFLYLETKYCDGKTGNKIQSELLSKNPMLQKMLDEKCSTLDTKNREDPKLQGVYDEKSDYYSRFKSLVELRGKLRHHSLKHKQRWNPNNHKPYEQAALFLGALVGGQVLEDGISELYSAPNEKKFFNAAEKSLATTEVINKIISIAPNGSINCNIILPCKTLNPRSVANCIKMLLKNNAQNFNIDTVVRIDAITKAFNLKAYEARLGPWCFTEDRTLKLENIDVIKVSCDYRDRGGNLSNVEFNATQWLTSSSISMGDAWHLLEKSLLHIENIHPPAQIHKVEVKVKNHRVPIISYYLGSGALN